MEICTFIEPQYGASYDEQLAFARATEDLGFHGFFRSDHILAFNDTDGLPGPSETWTVLGGLARETSRIRLGALVTAATFRHPSMLAIQVATVDAMSGGRVEFGLGTGWQEGEHRAYGIPFPEKRFDRFEEQLQVITGLWSTPVGDTFSFDGTHYQLTEAPALPKPVQSPVPLIIGGSGPSRTPALAAAYASEYNSWDLGDGPAVRFPRVRQAVIDAGREPGSMRYSVATSLKYGVPIPEVQQRVADAREVGADRIYLQFLDIRNMNYLEQVAAAVL